MLAMCLPSVDATDISPILTLMMDHTNSEPVITSLHKPLMATRRRPLSQSAARLGN
jgi:hypothetical protein